MKTKSALLAIGLFALSGGTTVSCGGSPGGGRSAGSAGSGGSLAGAGSTSTSGGGGMPNGSAGRALAGDSSSAGEGDAGGSSNSTAGYATGGRNDAGANAAGGAPSNAGTGGGSHDACPPTQPPPDTACRRGAGGFMGCNYGDQTCRCQPPASGGQSAMRTWVCTEVDPGGGGSSNVGQTSCPPNAMTGSDCMDGPGICAGQQCICNNQNKVQCF